MAAELKIVSWLYYCYTADNQIIVVTVDNYQRKW